MRRGRDTPSWRRCVGGRHWHGSNQRRGDDAQCEEYPSRPSRFAESRRCACLESGSASGHGGTPQSSRDDGQYHELNRMSETGGKRTLPYGSRAIMTVAAAVSGESPCSPPQKSACSSRRRSLPPLGRNRQLARWDRERLTNSKFAGWKPSFEREPRTKSRCGRFIPAMPSLLRRMATLFEAATP